MHKNFKIMAVTPAGRRRYIEILLKYILRDRHIVDEWVLWLNTTNKSDIEYCESLAKTHSFIKTVPLTWKYKENLSIFGFFKNCVDHDTIYLRLDDDIVWIEENAIEKLIDFRIQNPNYFLVFPNIINNAIISHIYQRFEILPLTHGICKYDVVDKLGWGNPQMAEIIHNSFFEGNPQKFKFPCWNLYFHEKISINSFAFFGKDFSKFNGAVGEDEERWLTMIKPKEDQKTNCIFGESLIVHFAFHTQRKYLENNTNLLARYKSLSELIIVPQNESTSHEQQTNDQSS